jgi:predicted signal transduction protein with EAL and GGDEF domain
MATMVVERIRGGVEELSVTGRRQRLTLSIGLTEAVPDDDAITLIARADKALYQAKSDGRDCMRMIRASDVIPSGAKASKSGSRGPAAVDLGVPDIGAPLVQR